MKDILEDGEENGNDTIIYWESFMIAQSGSLASPGSVQLSTMCIDGLTASLTALEPWP